MSHFLAQAAPAKGSVLLQLMPMILIFVVIWLLLLRPQMKKQKQHQQMISGVKKGNRIITSGGLHGVVTGVNEERKTITVKLSENARVEMERGSIQTILSEKTDKKDS